jgi:hypothetical protein
MSDDPKVCVNCHIMQPQYDSWQIACPRRRSRRASMRSSPATSS